MPEVKPGESRDDYVGRCIPVVLKEGTAEDQDQAAAICNSMWEKAHAKAWIDAQKGELWLSVEQVRELCPDCAGQMEAKGLSRINVLAIKEMPEQMLRGLCDKFGADEGFFTRCEGSGIPVDDKQGFCAWLHQECIGRWPGEKSLKIGRRNSAADQERLQMIHDYAVENGAVCPPKPEIVEMPFMMALDDEIVIPGGEIKALGENRYGGYLVRFSTAEDPDLTGDFFTRDTDFGEHRTTPIYWHHGLDPVIKRRVIGKGEITIDDAGAWLEYQLYVRDEYEKKIAQLHAENKVGLSSGTAPHLVERIPVGKAMWVKSWPLGLDASATTTPAEPRNGVIPLKSISYKSLFPQAEGAPEAAGDAAEGAAGPAPISQPEPSHEEAIMEISDELKTWLEEHDKTIVETAVKAVVDQLPATNGGGVNVQVTLDEADRPFLTLAEQCKAAKQFELTKGRNMDPRLKRLEIKATGAAEAVPSEGGFLLEPTITKPLITPLHEQGPFTKAVNRLPVGSDSNYGWINGVDETSRATGSRWGGIRGYRLAEGGTITASKPKFRRINWELKKYAVLVYGTDELLADASQFAAIVQQGAGEELNFMANDDVLNGDGAAGPLGILNSGALITVSAETGQTAATIVQENLNKMWARLDARSKPNAVWYINTDCNPQLDMLSISAGTSALEPRFVRYSPEGLMTIKGRPVIETEFNATLGTVGDIILADMSQYLYWEKAGIQAATSIHVQFLTDEQVFRFIYRCDGQTAMASAVTPYKGTNTVSAFIALATRS